MTPVISIKNLQKSYGANIVLRGINLDVEAGQIIGYIGPNGAGKSTTLKVLTGIIPDFSGEVSVLGIDVRRDPIAVKRRIGFIPEKRTVVRHVDPDGIPAFHRATPPFAACGD